MSNNEKAREKYERYNILITPSSELFKQTIVVMMSAILNCKLPCNFYIMQCTWTDEQKKECRKFISNYPNFNVEFITVNEDDFKDFTPWKGKYGTYYKLLSHVYLPESVDRILYLDCDSFINKDIYDYYSMDFEDNYLIGSTETLSLEIYNRFRQQGLEKHCYMNGGVVLFNIKKFKKDCITKETYLNALSEFDGSYLADQGIVSYVFDGKIKLLPSYKYNHLMFQEGTVNQTYTYKRIFSTPFQERTKLFTKEYWNEEFDEEHDATIVHFAGYFVVKPWFCIPEIISNDTSNIQRIIEIPNLHHTHLTKPVVEPFYVAWWRIAAKLPEKYFYQMLIDLEREASTRLKGELGGTKNALNFCQQLCVDTIKTQRFCRFINSLSEKRIVLLKVFDKAGVIMKEAAEFYGADITLSSAKATLKELSDSEMELCQKADVVISCCVHGTKTHERDGVKCIDIWDILRDDSLTANLPEISDGTDNIKIDGSISELHEDILKLSEHINEEFVKLSKISDEALKEEIKTLHSEKDKLNEELGRLSSENKSLTEHIAQITEEKSTLLENILSVSREKESLNSELFELNSKLNAEQNAASAAIRKADSLSADISLLKEKIAQLEKGKSIADSELDKTKQELKNEQEASAASAQKAELLNNKILKMQSTRSWRYTRIFRKNKKDEEL